jgi:hypothetical protein
MMSTTLTRRILLLPFFGLLIAAKPLVDPAPIQTPAALSDKEVRTTLRRTLAARSWIISKEDRGELIATLNVRTHALTVRFADGDGRIAMNYVDSVDLQYSVRSNGTRMIHRKYAGWMTNLSNAIKADLQLAVLEKSG